MLWRKSAGLIACLTAGLLGCDGFIDSSNLPTGASPRAFSGLELALQLPYVSYVETVRVVCGRDGAPSVERNVTIGSSALQFSLYIAPIEVGAGYWCELTARSAHGEIRCDGIARGIQVLHDHITTVLLAIPCVDYTQCDAGEQYDLGAEDCRPCPPGSSSEGFDTICTACEPGTYAPLVGSADCLPCPMHSFTAVPGSVTCQPCSLGTTTASVGSTQCL